MTTKSIGGIAAAAALGATMLLAAAPDVLARSMNVRPAVVSPLKPVQTRVPGILVKAALLSAFQGTRLRLNNYGPKRGGSWHWKNSSFVRLGPRLGGTSKRFNIPEYRKGSFRYYVNDVKLARLDAGIEGGSFRITARFESKGTEFKGRCKGYKCVLGSDRSAPDVNWKKPSIVILLTPGAMNGSLTYRQVQIRVKGKLAGNGPCRLPGDPCNMFTRYKSRIKKAVVFGLSAQLMKPSVRRRLAQQLRPLLDRFRIGSVQSVRVSGGDLIITHYKRRPRTA